jgi:hypothetical protein
MKGDIRVDISGAIKKTKTALAIPQATRYQLEKWSKDCILPLKISARELKKSGHPTANLFRNIDATSSLTADHYEVSVGTGVGRAKSVIYAAIQNFGGITHPRVTKKMRGWAWYMLKKTGLEIYKGIALTKKDRLNVRIPASHWFSRVMDKRVPLLNQMMKEKQIIITAQKLSGGANAE